MGDANSRDSGGLRASEAATHESSLERFTIQADRTARGLKDIEAAYCIEQFKELAKKFRLTKKGREEFLNFATEMYLLGNTDLQYFMKDEVGITIDAEKHKPRYGRLKALYNEIKPNHKIIFE
jgi:hypothetical protein